MSREEASDESKDLKLHFLVLRCQVGDEQAFGELYSDFSSKTLRYLRNVVGNDEGEDLNQEVWLTVYKRIKTLSNPSAFRMWLFQMARNKTLDYFRKTKRISEFEEVYKVNQESEKAELESVDDIDEVKNTLESNLEKLPNKHREVLILNFLEGMDYDEIALIVGSSLGTVKSRIYNAKVKLKYLMNKT